MLQNNLLFGNQFIRYLKRLIFLKMKLFILLKVQQNIVDLKNTEWNITVTDLEFFLYFTREDLFNNHNFKTNTRLWNNKIHDKTANKITETSTSPKKYSMTDYFNCRYHLTLFRMALLGTAHV